MEKAASYNPKPRQNSLLYNIVNDNLETFLAMGNGDPNKKGLPKYVEKEFREYLKCGIFAEGFCLLRCIGDTKKDICRSDQIIPFSCKYRGFCPSCAARRMHSKSIYLSEKILPKVDYRQWVMSFPFALRYWMASDDRILKKVNKICVAEISKFLRQKLGKINGKKLECGLISFFQRSSADLALNYHFHILAMDGIFSWNKDPKVKPKFHKIKQPTNEEIQRVLVRIRDRTMQYLVKIRKLIIDHGEFTFSDLTNEFDERGNIKIAAIRRRIAIGKRAGEKVRTIGKSFGKSGEYVKITGEKTASVNGFSLHANRMVKAKNRDELEFLIRYISRGELSENSLSLDSNGDVILALKREFRDGTTAIQLSPLELLEKISSIIPYPYKNLITYSGCFAPNSKMRPLIIINQEETPPKSANNPHYIPWAELLRRVYREDLTQCPYCEGVRKIVAIVTRADLIRKILLLLNIPPDPLVTFPSTFEEHQYYQVY